MITVDTILYNAIVLTMDDDFRIFEPGAVAIKEDTILAVGKEELIKREYQSKANINCHLQLLMPGFINAHTHVPMTLLRGLADDLRLDVWLNGYMMPVEREFVNPDFVRLGTKLACAEMIRSGVTCFADMYYFEDDVAEATAEVGMRALPGQTVMKYPTPDASSFEEGLELAEYFIKKWKDHPLILPTIAPHAPYTCTPEILQSCADIAIKYDVPIQIHVAETALEVESLREETGMPVVPYIKKNGIMDAKVIAAHCVHIDEGEIRSLQHAKAGVAHNPTSNLKLASGFAPIQKMLDLKVNVGIGTDGPASNNDLDMIEEMRLATFIAKVTTSDPTAMPARQTLTMATRMGAQALHIDHLTGSLESGKRADLILIDISPVHNSPRFKRDPNGVYAQVVFASKATDITDVMVNGKWLMRERVLTTIDEEAYLKQGNLLAEKIDKFLISREKSVLSKLIAIGGSMEEESFEIQCKVKVDDTKNIMVALKQESIEIERTRHYHEFDTYFIFEDQEQGTLRYREDEFLDERGQITNVRSRLTLIGQKNEKTPEQSVMLSRSRYIAPATHSLRFYREYFQPKRELEIEKLRKRFLINYKEFDFFVNVDTIIKPDMGHFVEVKSRTWSRQDAVYKSKILSELIEVLGLSPALIVTEDYFHLVDRRN